MSFLHHITRPLREHTSSFFLSNTGNRNIPALNLSRRWWSQMDVEDAKSFQKKTTGKLPVLAYFYKPQCQFCKIFEEKLSEVIKDSKDIDLLLKVNVENGRAIAEKYKVDAVPTVMGFKKGKEVDKIIGNVQKDVIEKMVENLK